MARWSRTFLGAAWLLLAIQSGGVWAQEAKGEPEAGRPGRFFTVEEPISGASNESLESAVDRFVQKTAAEGGRPFLIFEFRASRDAGETRFFAAAALAEYISKDLAGTSHTVAYIPEPLAGPAVLAALACDDIVMGKDATLGPIIPRDREAFDIRTARSLVDTLSSRKGRQVDLLLGILDPEEDLREVTFEDGRIEYALASKLEKLAGVAQAKPVWEARQRGTLTAEQARRGLSNLIASDRAAIRDWYKLPSTADDPTLFSGVKPVIISITRPIDPMTDDYVKKALARARGQGANLIFLRLDCEGGLPESAERIVQSLGELDQEIKTVAFVESRALGVASLLLWACDEIVLGADARIGDLPRKVSTAGSEAIDAATLAVLEEKAQALAARKGHPPGIAAGIFNRTMSVVQALDTQTGAVTAVLQSEVDRNPGRYLVQNRIKPAGDVLVVTSENAVALGVARRVGVTRAELYREYGVEGNVREEEPSWVDALVTVLNTPWVSWLLLFVGLFMLILELKLPGVGLPAIISALCFILFFWGHSRAGTADTLEILLFLTGIVCLVLELFVFPGIGVFGVCGVLLVLVSIVMASHTFVWPTQDYEYRQLGGTLLAVMGTIVAVGVGAFTLGKFLPSFPVFRRLVLVPEPATGSGEDFAKPALDPSETPLLFLLGERGRTTTVLRPTGKARFGDFLADVTADGFYIEANTPVEVVEVRGSKVIVKRA